MGSAIGTAVGVGSGAAGLGVAVAAGAAGLGVAVAAGAAGLGVAVAAGAAGLGVAVAAGLGVAVAAGAAGLGVAVAAGATGTGVAVASGAAGTGVAVGRGVDVASSPPQAIPITRTISRGMKTNHLGFSNQWYATIAPRVFMWCIYYSQHEALSDTVYHLLTVLSMGLRLSIIPYVRYVIVQGFLITRSMNG